MAVPTVPHLALVLHVPEVQVLVRGQSRAGSQSQEAPATKQDPQVESASVHQGETSASKANHCPVATKLRFPPIAVKGWRSKIMQLIGCIRSELC